MASKITYHESYGTVSVAQLRAYKKFNVSPSDHDFLVMDLGEENHAAITQFVIDNSKSGMYRAPLPW